MYFETSQMLDQLNFGICRHYHIVLGLYILSAYEASLDLWRQILRPTEEELSLWSSGVGPDLPAW
jgi:hypothetical protein